MIKLVLTGYLTCELLLMSCGVNNDYIYGAEKTINQNNQGSGKNLITRETDRLSGTYEVQMSELEQQLFEISKEAKPPGFIVKKTINGWLMVQKEFHVELKPPKNPSKFYIEFFPNTGNQSEIQCATSVRIILCHVKPYSIIENEIISSTGYFIIVLHYGLVELIKVF